MNADQEDGTFDEQERAWVALYDQIVRVMRRYGVEDHLCNEDYLIVDDNYGWTRHKIEVQKLRVINPEVVAGLRALLDSYPDWSIVMAVDVPGTEDTWPLMG